jgi:hypothetical protein
MRRRDGHMFRDWALQTLALFFGLLVIGAVGLGAFALLAWIGQGALYLGLLLAACGGFVALTKTLE